MMKKNITKHKVREWLGTDNQLEEAIEIIRDMANGDYSVELLKKDIIEYYNGNWKYMEEK